MFEWKNFNQKLKLKFYLPIKSHCESQYCTECKSCNVSFTFENNVITHTKRSFQVDETQAICIEPLITITIRKKYMYANIQNTHIIYSFSVSSKPYRSVIVRGTEEQSINNFMMLHYMTIGQCGCNYYQCYTCSYFLFGFIIQYI